MKKVLITIGLLAIATVSGCAVVPYEPGPYYQPAPYYGARPYYGPPAVIVTEPVFVPRHRHHGWRR